MLAMDMWGLELEKVQGPSLIWGELQMRTDYED